MTRRYRAFISYSWADKEWGGWLHRTLELYRTPRALIGRETPLGSVPAGLHPIFKDREEEAAGHGVGAAIEAALAASDFLIVICSPRSANSTWVNREVAWFKTHKDKSRILALIVDGEPGAAARGDHAAECFPKTLTMKVGMDLQPTEEAEDPPLAADARKEGDGKRGAKLKLAAALLGVGLDDLVRRDERRRSLRRRWMMSGMAAGMTTFAGIALYAGAQRDAAILARNDAVTARDDAEGLIELILTDLKTDLEGYGTLKSVTQIGNRAIGYYEGQDVKTLTPDQLGRRARVLLMLGEADNKRGDLDAALARYETAAATTSEQLMRDPENAQRIFDHAQSVFWVGYIAWQRGDRVKAKAQFTEYHDHAQRLVAIDPTNDDWQAELEYAYSNLGTLAMDEGEAAEAEMWFRKSLVILNQQLGSKPYDVDRVLVTGQSYAWLADALFAQGRIQEAATSRKSEIGGYNSFEGSTEDDTRIKRARAVSYAKLAEIYLAAGSVSSAIMHAELSAALQKGLLDADSENVDELRRASFTFAVLGEMLLYSPRSIDSKAAIRRSIDLAETASRVDQVDTWNRLALARPKILLARASLREGRAQDARLEIDEVVTMLEQAAADDDSSLKSILASALALQARTSSKFQSNWRSIVELLEPIDQLHRPETMCVLIEALQQTGDHTDARRLAVQLRNAGYRHPEFIKLLGELQNFETGAP